MITIKSKLIDHSFIDESQPLQVTDEEIYQSIAKIIDVDVNFIKVINYTVTIHPYEIVEIVRDLLTK